MKEILLFVLKGCPHCRLALQCQEELLQAHPEWRDIPLRVIDEREEADLADSYDYFYVPTYYVGGEKVHEGHAEREDVERCSGWRRRNKKEARTVRASFLQIVEGIHIPELPGVGRLHQDQPVGMGLDHRSAAGVAGEGQELRVKFPGKERRVAPLSTPGQGADAVGRFLKGI